MARKVARKDNESESKELKIFSTDLPSEVITKILLGLPIKNIFICKSVCKGLNSRISNPDFAQMHVKHTPTGFMLRTNDPDRLSRFVHLLEYEPEMFQNDGGDSFCFCKDGFIEPECENHVIFDHKFKLPVHVPKLILDNRDQTLNKGGQSLYTAYQPENSKFDVVNSCAGFLCLCDRNKEYFVVCNPIIGEFIRLPKTTKTYRTTIYRVDAIYTGFGFHDKTNQYKVVRILHKRRIWREPKMIMTVEMHTLGTSTWRNVGDFDDNICELGFPTCVNEALHWICLDDNERSISRFHFEHEKFDSLPFPQGSENGISGTRNITMGVLNECLYICDSSFLDIPIRMWIMKDYGVEESWTRAFSIDTMIRYCWPYGGLYWPVQKFKSPAAILLYHSSNCFIYYEFRRRQFKCFKVCGSESNLEGIPHIPSHISLKNIVKGGNIKVVDINSRSSKFKLVEEDEVLFLGEGGLQAFRQKRIYP
ncbi:F-box/kelch-repeat protein At3g06240-like [Lotus japonicus]|uniref:F-box/kelch-repeat protein At3g06240-like n=1 Tax=Lotus japonicus TaxID=34305 RepID=UPI0025909735|nr:F-box/kelch-repeat protein At3g06240-like [Lotus japonicus]